MKANIKLIVIFLITFISADVLANYTCTGKVEGVAIGPTSGKLLIEKLDQLVWVELCSVETPYNNIQPETCKQIYSMLMAAQVAKKDVTFWFNDDSDGMNCSNHESWKPLTGWYFGPKISG